MSLHISKTIRGKYPELPYEAMKNDILGKEYDLSLAFVGNTRARALNTMYRNKTYIPNVLSFPLNAQTGEVVINPHVAKKEAPRFGMSVIGHIGFLFIHGLLHLKGHDHGATMEKAEKKYISKYNLK